MFARLLAGIEGQRLENQTQIQQQQVINTSVSEQLASINAFLATLQHNTHK
jgi:hypothetical protein